MTDRSRSQVTITLGRTGQVVKRTLDGDFCDTDPAIGSKRSIRDRLESPLDNKRQSGVDGRLSVKDTHLSKHDLRLKIKKQTQQKNVDLRDMLSRKARPLSTNNRMVRTLPEPRSSRQRAPQLTPEPMNDRRRIPEPKDDQWPVPEPRDGRRLTGDPIEVGPRMPNLYDNRERILEPTDDVMPCRVTSMRTSKSLSQMDLSGNSFSLSTLDHIRPRSPNRVLDNVEHLTVESFLHSLGLDKYVLSFRVEEVDMAVLSQMKEHDLKEMGIHMGPRKKIMLALLARTRRQAR